MDDERVQGCHQRVVGYSREEFCQICETGCGEGEITSFIKDMYQNAEIDAFDISEKVIARPVKRFMVLTFILEISIQWRFESREKLKNTF